MNKLYPELNFFISNNSNLLSSSLTIFIFTSVIGNHKDDMDFIVQK